MINFHKYSFLDCKRLKAYLTGSHSYLSEYNPIYLFVWSDLYKPEISFTNDYIFIRYQLSDLGKVYFPPLPVSGNGNLKMTLLEMEDDAKENNIDFKLGPVLDQDISKFKALSYYVYENKKRNTYIFSSDELSKIGLTSKLYKADCKQFEKEHKNVFLKKTKKEDFPQLIEFLSVYRESAKVDKDDYNFFPKLNALKKCMDHLYEFDLIGVSLQDENEMYGYAIGSIMDNCFYLHLLFAKEDVKGAKISLLMGIVKYTGVQTRFVCLPSDLGDLDTIKFYESLKPQRQERFNLSIEEK